METNIEVLQGLLSQIIDINTGYLAAIVAKDQRILADVQRIAELEQRIMELECVYGMPKGAEVSQ